MLGAPLLQHCNHLMRRLVIYFLLLAGTLVFAWPFLWMASTSVKLDRELFGDRVRFWPQRPVPQTRSPYIDTVRFGGVRGPAFERARPMIEAAVAALNYHWPSGVDSEIARRETARGLFVRLNTIIPHERWNLADEVLRNIIAQSIDLALVNETVAGLRRAFCVGQLRARSYDLQEDELVPPESAAGAWTVGGSGRAELTQAGTAAEPFAELKYDLSAGDTIVLRQNFKTSFPIERLHRVRMSLRYDDTWHALTLYIEKNGALYRAERTLESSDHNWVVNNWQERGPDDQPNKTRTWTLLSEIDHGPQYLSGPNDLGVRLELQRSNAWQAWWPKIRRNYRLTFDYIPFWRYVSTSVFLVILNVFGTLLSCSLVAYSFARLQWPGRTVAFALLLATMMIPPQVTMIPQFMIVQKLGWYNTLFPLWVPSFFATAFFVFLMRQFLKGVPRDLEDAARLDGCGFLRIYWHIMLPLVKPVLAAIAILTFLATWNEFMTPLIYLSDQRLYPLSFGLYAFQIEVAQPGNATGMGMLMAGSLLMTLPVIVIFFFTQRYFLRGVTLTGMKG